MQDYIKVKTTDNTAVWLRKDQVAAVEEIQGTARTNAYLKLYVAGYSFNVEATSDDILKLLDSDETGVLP